MNIQWIFGVVALPVEEVGWCDGVIFQVPLDGWAHSIVILNWPWNRRWMQPTSEDAHNADAMQSGHI